MRRFIAATLTAALVVIGFSAVLIGTASASTPVPTVSGSCSELKVQLSLAVGLVVPGAVTQEQKDQRIANIKAQMASQNCDTNGGSNNNCPVDQNPRVPGCQNSGPIYGGGHNNGGTWNDRLDGRYFRLDRGPALDVCDSGYSSYDLFLSRNGSYRDRISRQLNAQRFADLRRADCGVVVSNNGDCVTYVTARDSLRNYTNDYNRLRGVYNGDFNRLNRGDRDNLNRLWTSANRYRGQWDSTLSRLRTVCQDTTPPVVIVNQAPPAPVVVTQAAPAPVYSAPAPSGVSGGSIPQGSVNTGGWSPAFVLAHNHAV